MNTENNNGFEAVLTENKFSQNEQIELEWNETKRKAMEFLTKNSSGLETMGPEARLALVKKLTKYLEWRKYETVLLKLAEARLYQLIKLGEKQTQ